MSMATLSAQMTSFNGMGTGDQFPNPWLDVASSAMPTNFRNALYMAEYIYDSFGTYRAAMRRIHSYFLTDIEIRNVSEDVRKKWVTFLNDVLGLISVTREGLDDFAAYGNGFFSVLRPFKRFLRCPKCGSMYQLNAIFDNHQTFNFRFDIPRFIASCPTCKVGSKYRGAWIIADQPHDEEKKLKIKRWSPHEIEMLHCHENDNAVYFWRIPEQYKRDVKKGNLFHLENVSEPVLNAIARNQLFRFDDDAVFHMKESTLAGRLNRGWGFPRIFINFRQIYYVQVLRRFNEAIALDYVIPFRLITPGTRPGSTGAAGGMTMDPLLMYNGGDFRGQVMSMLRKRRRDPATWQTLPFPVNYQMLGAEANKLAPRDLLDQGLEILLNDAGTPVELFKGSLQLQTAPVALRLFESTNASLVYQIKELWRWVVRQVCQLLSWEVVDAQLKRVTLADDMQKQMAALQLFMSQQLSGTTALAGLGFDWLQEQKQLAEEARAQAEVQSRTQEEMAQAGFGDAIAKGNMPTQGGAGAGGQGGGDAGAGGGDPAAAGGAQGGAAGAMGQPPGPVSQYIQSLSPDTPVTVQDLLSAADSIANDLLGLPESQKDSELRKLRSSNEALHSMVRSRMDQKRSASRKAAQNASGVG